MNIELKFKIYQLREKNGLSTRDLSRISGISRSCINEIENNCGNPTLKTVCKLALALNVMPEDVYEYHVIKKSDAK